MTVTPVEDVMDDTATTPEDTPVDIDVLDNDTFNPNSDVEVTDVTDPANGTVTINADGTVTYTPDPDYIGEDTFDYTVTVTNPDGSTTTETATVTVTVTPVEDVMDDTATTPEDTPVDIDVLDNDTFNPNSDVEVTDVTDPANGTVTINADGTVTYTPDPDYIGEDTFDYTVTVTNPDGSTTTETATVTVTVTPVEDVMDDTATTPEDTPVDIDVLDNDTFNPNSDVEVTDVTDPANGTVTINADGTVTYTPDPNYNGTDTFDYTVTVTNPDGSTTTETATVTVIVTPDNPSLELLKDGVYEDTNGDGVVNEGDLVIYTFTVTNNGDVPLFGIIVTDPLVTVNGGPIDLGVGESDNTTFTASYAITQDDIDAGVVYNLATATGADQAGEPATDTSEDPTPMGPIDPQCPDCTITILPQDPAIAILKVGVFNDEDADGCSDVDETITYTFTVTNEGNVSLSDIVVTDPLIAGITFVDGDTDGDGELDVTETWTYTADYAITQDDIDAGQVTNQATVAGTDTNDNPLSDLSDDTSVLEDNPTVSPLCQSPAIAILKVGVFNDEDADGCSDVDETITYSFTVTNEGNVSLSDIVVTDPLIAGITFVDGDTDGDGELDVTETWTYTADYAITQDDIDAGQVTNQATV
ncbi:conserved repeat domain-containing protein, partial [Dokdonia pacifica]